MAKGREAGKPRQLDLGGGVSLRRNSEFAAVQLVGRYDRNYNHWCQRLGVWRDRMEVVSHLLNIRWEVYRRCPWKGKGPIGLRRKIVPTLLFHGLSEDSTEAAPSFQPLTALDWSNLEIFLLCICREEKSELNTARLDCGSKGGHQPSGALACGTDVSRGVRDATNRHSHSLGGLCHHQEQ